MEVLMPTSSTALVTGASAGIGAVYADRLARRGHDLILVARDEARLRSLADRIRTTTGRNVDVMRADLTCREDLLAVEQRLSTDAKIGMLVNNAGVAAMGTILDNEAVVTPPMSGINADRRLDGPLAIV
jgi:uncharacterized protein